MNFYSVAAIFAFGCLFGGAAMKVYHERKGLDVRVALGDLVRACEGDTCTLGSEAINKALKKAHKALER